VVYFEVGKQSHEAFYGVVRNSKVGQNGCDSLHISVALFRSGA